jgi:hypothetical protein
MAQSSTAFTLIILYLHIDHHPPSPRSLCTISASSQSSCFGSSGTCIHFTLQNHGVRHYLSILFRLAYHVIFHLILLGHSFTSTTNAFRIMAPPTHFQRSSHPSRSICTSSSLACIYNTTPSTHTHGSVHTADTKPEIIHNIHSHSIPFSSLLFMVSPRRHETTLRLSSILFSSTYPSPFAIFFIALFHSDALSPLD